MSEDLSTIQVEKVVDARGTSCPGPILARQEGHPERLGGWRHGGPGDDTGTQKDLPAWCKKMGHEFLGVVEEPSFMKLYVKKMK